MQHDYRMDIFNLVQDIIKLLRFFYITYGLANCCNILSLIVGNLNIELLFEFHNQLNSIQGIGSQVVGKASFGYNFVLINTQFINDDSFYS